MALDNVLWVLLVAAAVIAGAAWLEAYAVRCYWQSPAPGQPAALLLCVGRSRYWLLRTRGP